MDEMLHQCTVHDSDTLRERETEFDEYDLLFLATCVYIYI